jgi:hypothetical protein
VLSMVAERRGYVEEWAKDSRELLSKLKHEGFVDPRGPPMRFPVEAEEGASALAVGIHSMQVIRPSLAESKPALGRVQIKTLMAQP